MKFSKMYKKKIKDVIYVVDEIDNASSPYVDNCPQYGHCHDQVHHLESPQH